MWHHLILRIFRVLLATIRNQGGCPCPRCLVPTPKVDRLGLVSDNNIRINKARKYNSVRVNIARKLIYEDGVPIKGSRVEALLKATSAVPTSVSMSYYSHTYTMIDHCSILERVYRETRSQFRCIPHARRRLHARGRNRCMERPVQTSSTHSLHSCSRWKTRSRSG